MSLNSEYNSKCQYCSRKENTFETYSANQYIKLIDACLTCAIDTQDIYKLFEFNFLTLTAYAFKKAGILTLYKFAELYGVGYKRIQQAVNRMEKKHEKDDFLSRIDRKSIIQALKGMQKFIEFQKKKTKPAITSDSI